MTEKYQPLALEDFVFSDEDTRLQLEAIISGEYELPSVGTTGILLYGPPGTGKSALANRLPYWIEGALGNDSPVFEVFNCGEGRDDGKKLIQMLDKQLKVCSGGFNQKGVHYFVLDEIDHVSRKTQMALKGILNSKWGLFILTTNKMPDVDQKLKDRCLCLPMLAAPAEKWMPLAKRIAADHAFAGDDETLLAACAHANGSARELYRTIVMTALKARAATKRLLGNMGEVPS